MGRRAKRRSLARNPLTVERMVFGAAVCYFRRSSGLQSESIGKIRFHVFMKSYRDTGREKEGCIRWNRLKNGGELPRDVMNYAITLLAERDEKLQWKYWLTELMCRFGGRGNLPI